MGIAEELREKARSLRRSNDFVCKDFVAIEFGISSPCKSPRRCCDCYADMFERIADRIDAERALPEGIDAERALPEGIEWPRFEDGELVKIGDEVEFEGETWKVRCVILRGECWALNVERGYDLVTGRGEYGEPVKRPTPKVLGADGVPINVGDTVYFADGNGSALIVERIDANGGEPAVDLVYEGERTRWHSANPENLTHERPDSWERLEEDMKGGPTEYARDILGVNVRTTTTSEDYETFARDTVRRAKALAKAGEVE